MIYKILENVGEYQQNSSEWYFKEVVHLEIHTVDCNPMRGSSYIPLPDWIMRKKAIVNIRNTDEKCFLWCVLRYLHPREKNDVRLTDLKQYENDLNTKGIDYPVQLRDISKFENLNPALPGINVFSGNENNKFYPLRMAQRHTQQTIDLFLHEQDGKYHYSLIKNFSRLFRSQITLRTNGKIFFARNVLLTSQQSDYSKNISNIVHPMKQLLCVCLLETQSYVLIITTNNSVVVYADFECFAKPMNTCSPNPEDSHTYSYQKHEPSGFCLYIRGLVPNTTLKPILYTKTTKSDDIPAIFVSKLAGITNKIYNDFYYQPLPLKLTKQSQEEFNKAEFCHICNKALNGDKVRDYCLFTGVYRGAAHISCNLKCRKPMILLVIFHNLQGYDAHLFIKQLSRLPDELNCIPSTEEKYISFSKKIKVNENISRKNGETVSVYFELRFIDSYKFLQTSLSDFVGNLQPDDFYNTKAIYQENIELLTR